jgi:hypothetical protein
MAYISFQPSDYFNTKLYTGNGVSGTGITGVGFKPDWLWTKERSSTSSHTSTDIVRGANVSLNQDSNGAQATETQSIISFDTDGFTVGSGGGVNQSSQTYVGWSWLAGGSQGSSNTDGSINTTYTSVNTTSGFSISTYTGTGSAGTIGHGLGVKPSMILCKRLTGSAESWVVYHQSLDASAPQDKYLHLNTTDAVGDSAGMWNDTAPTTSVFSVGSTGVSNGSGGTFVAYCFAEKTGFSKFGSYTGNGNADGAFIYTGFKPAFVLIKATDVDEWRIYDNKRANPFNVIDVRLKANSSDAESSGNNECDFLSNGIKIRSNSGGVGSSGQEYIYMCFAESSIVSSNGVPATAR